LTDGFDGTPLDSVENFESTEYYFQNNNGSYLGIDSAKLTTRKKIGINVKPKFRWLCQKIEGAEGKVAITAMNEFSLRSDVPKNPKGKSVFIQPLKKGPPEAWIIAEVQGLASVRYIQGSKGSLLGVRHDDSAHRDNDIYTRKAKTEQEQWRMIKCSEADAGNVPLVSGNEYFIMDQMDLHLAMIKGKLDCSPRKHIATKWVLHFDENSEDDDYCRIVPAGDPNLELQGNEDKAFIGPLDGFEWQVRDAETVDNQKHIIQPVFEKKFQAVCDGNFSINGVKEGVVMNGWRFMDASGYADDDGLGDYGDKNKLGLGFGDGSGNGDGTLAIHNGKTFSMDGEAVIVDGGQYFLVDDALHYLSVRGKNDINLAGPGPPSTMGRREKWILRMPDGEEKARVEHIDGIALSSDMTDMLPVMVPESQESWRISLVGTEDHRRFLTSNSAARQLSMNAMSQPVLASTKNVTEHWKFIAADRFADYPEGYGDGYADEGEINIQDNMEYFLVDDDNMCLAVRGHDDQKEVYASTGLRGKREKWITQIQSRDNDTNECTVVLQNKDGPVFLLTDGDGKLIINQKNNESFTLSDVVGMPGVKWVSTFDGLNIGALDGIHHVEKAYSDAEHWRFIDASKFPDTPPGYGDGMNKNLVFPGPGVDPIEEDEEYFIVDDWDRCLSVADPTGLTTTGPFKGRKEKFFLKIKEEKGRKFGVITSKDQHMIYFGEQGGRSMPLIAGGEFSSKMPPPYSWKLRLIGTPDIRRFICTNINTYLSANLDGFVHAQDAHSVNAHAEKYLAAQWRVVSAKGFPDYPPAYPGAEGLKPCPLDACDQNPQPTWCANMMAENDAMGNKLAKVEKQTADAEKTIKKKLEGVEGSQVDDLKQKLKRKKKDIGRLNARGKALEKEKIQFDAVKKKQEKGEKKKGSANKEGDDEHEKNVTVVEVQRLGVPCPDPSIHIELRMQWEFLTTDNVWKRLPIEVMNEIEFGINDGLDMKAILVNGVKNVVNIKGRSITNTKSGVTSQIRRRQPKLSHLVVMPGSIGVGDKAISGADLLMGAPRPGGVQHYETLLATKYNVNNAYKDPPARKKKMTEEELAEYWGITTPINEGESKYKELTKKLEDTRKEYDLVMAEFMKAKEDSFSIQDKIKELEVFAD